MSAILSDAARAALSSAVATTDTVRLTCGALPRPVYVEVNEVLTRLGGKWKGGKTAAHVFPFDPALALAAVVESGELPAKNPNAFFPTPPAVVALMLEAVEQPPHGAPRVLEPSAGDGAIVDAVRATWPEADVEAVELDTRRAAQLRAKGYDVHEGDFLTYDVTLAAGQYDAVLMNPPFAVAGDALAYITHIERAWSLVRPGGVVVAIAPVGFTFRTDRRCAAFRALVEQHGGVELLDDGAFKESGTNVRTALVVLRKPVVMERAA